MNLGQTTVYAGGRFCTYDEAKVGLLTHGLQYGTGCFEGIRGYWVPERPEFFWFSCERITNAWRSRRRS